MCLRIGQHASLDNIAVVYSRLIACGIRSPVIQIFSTPQLINESGRDGHDDIQLLPSTIRSAIVRGTLTLLIHGTYKNVFTGDSAAVHLLNTELAAAKTLGAAGVIIHLNRNACEGIHNLLRNIIIPHGVTLWFEINSARSSSDTFETPMKLKHFVDLLATTKVDINNGRPQSAVGLCIDTAHVFACGVSFRAREFTEQWLAQLTAATESAHIPIMFHLNDCAAPLGSGRDIHAAVGSGLIWGDLILPISTTGLIPILDYAQQHESLIVLERSPEADVTDELNLIKSFGYSC